MRSRVGRAEGKPTHAVGGLCAVFACGVVVMGGVFAGSAEGARIELRGEASVSSEVVRLSDVARVEGSGAEGLAVLEVGRIEGGAGRVTIERGALKAALEEAGVNWGLHELGGTLRVEVGRAAGGVARDERRREGGEERSAGVSAGANVRRRVSINGEGIGAGSGWAAGGRTVRDVVTEYLRESIGVQSGEVLELAFEEEGAAGLAAWAGDSRFEIKPLTTDLLGRATLVVSRIDGERQTGSERFTVTSRLQRSAVVMKRAVGRGQTLTSDDVEVREVWLESGRETIGALEGVIGQRAVGAMGEGMVVEANDVEPAVVVRRRDLIRVRVVRGSLVMRMLGRAMEEGAVGQVIVVRNDRGRGELRARVTGPGEAELVNDEGGEELAVTTEARR